MTHTCPEYQKWSAAKAADAEFGACDDCLLRAAGACVYRSVGMAHPADSRNAALHAAALDAAREDEG